MFAQRVGGACAFLFLGAMSMAQSSHDPEQSSDPAVRVFSALRTQWASNLHEKRVDACVAQYDADAEFLLPDGGRVQGAAALHQLFEQITGMFDSTLVFDSRRTHVSGNLAYDAGDFREVLTLRETGKQLFSTGTYLTLYRRTETNNWVIVEQVWTGPEPDKMTKLDLAPHPVVALTFDDLPAAGTLPVTMTREEIAKSIAAKLNAEGMTGTYGFVNASRLENNADAEKALHAWVDAGMNIGSHTWAHISLTSHTPEEFEQQVTQNEPALHQYAQGRDWHWFRYPFLWEGDTLEKRHAVRAFLAQHKYRIAQVSLDFEDYAWNDAFARCTTKKEDAAVEWLRQSYLETAKEYIQLGRQEELIAFGHEIPNVMLLHATGFTSLMLPDLIDLLRKEGFQFASLPEVEKDPAYAMDPDAALKYGGTLPDQFMDSRHLKYPPVAPKPFEKLKTLCP